MDIHKPKAAHSWREFLTEIGTIICGILIALGLEQAIEAMHWRHMTESGEERLRGEIQGNLANSYGRLVLKDCYNARLTEVRDALLKPGVWKGMPVDMTAPAGSKVRVSPMQAAGILTSAAPPVYLPWFTLWPDDAWETARGAGISLHLKPDRAAEYARLYRSFSSLQESANNEFQLVARLSPLSLTRALSASDRTIYLNIIGELNFENIKAAAASNSTIGAADHMGIRLQRKAANALVDRFRHDPRSVHCVEPVTIPTADN
jgi:hypothetical protein